MIYAPLLFPNSGFFPCPLQNRQTLTCGTVKMSSSSKCSSCFFVATSNEFNILKCKDQENIISGLWVGSCGQKATQKSFWTSRAPPEWRWEKFQKQRRRQHHESNQIANIFRLSQPSLFSAVGLKSMIDSTANFFLSSLSPRFADLEMDSLTINGFFFPASESTICKICSVQYGGEIPNKLIWQFREIGSVFAYLPWLLSGVSWSTLPARRQPILLPLPRRKRRFLLLLLLPRLPLLRWRRTALRAQKASYLHFFHLSLTF